MDTNGWKHRPKRKHYIHRKNTPYTNTQHLFFFHNVHVSCCNIYTLEIEYTVTYTMLNAMDEQQSCSPFRVLRYIPRPVAMASVASPKLATLCIRVPLYSNPVGQISSSPEWHHGRNRCQISASARQGPMLCVQQDRREPKKFEHVWNVQTNRLKSMFYCALQKMKVEFRWMLSSN